MKYIFRSDVVLKEQLTRFIWQEIPRRDSIDIYNPEVWSSLDALDQKIDYRKEFSSFFYYKESQSQVQSDEGIKLLSYKQKSDLFDALLSTNLEEQEIKLTSVQEARLKQFEFLTTFLLALKSVIKNGEGEDYLSGFAYLINRSNPFGFDFDLFWNELCIFEENISNLQLQLMFPKINNGDNDNPVFSNLDDVMKEFCKRDGMSNFKKHLLELEETHFFGLIPQNQFEGGILRDVQNSEQVLHYGLNVIQMLRDSHMGGHSTQAQALCVEILGQHFDDVSRREDFQKEFKRKESELRKDAEEDVEDQFSHEQRYQYYIAFRDQKIKQWYEENPGENMMEDVEKQISGEAASMRDDMVDDLKKFHFQNSKNKMIANFIYDHNLQGEKGWTDMERKIFGEYEGALGLAWWDLSDSGENVLAQVITGGLEFVLAGGVVKGSSLILRQFLRISSINKLWRGTEVVANVLSKSVRASFPRFARIGSFIGQGVRFAPHAVAFEACHDALIEQEWFFDSPDWIQRAAMSTLTMWTFYSVHNGIKALPRNLRISSDSTMVSKIFDSISKSKAMNPTSVAGKKLKASLVYMGAVGAEALALFTIQLGHELFASGFSYKKLVEFFTEDIADNVLQTLLTTASMRIGHHLLQRYRNQDWDGVMEALRNPTSKPQTKEQTSVKKEKKAPSEKMIESKEEGSLYKETRVSETLSGKGKEATIPLNKHDIIISVRNRRRALGGWESLNVSVIFRNNNYWIRYKPEGASVFEYRKVDAGSTIVADGSKDLKGLEFRKSGDDIVIKKLNRGREFQLEREQPSLKKGDVVQLKPQEHQRLDVYKPTKDGKRVLVVSVAVKDGRFFYKEGNKSGLEIRDNGEIRTVRTDGGKEVLEIHLVHKSDGTYAEIKKTEGKTPFFVSPVWKSL